MLPIAVVAAALLWIGIEAFARRDLGAPAAINLPELPDALLGLRYTFGFRGGTLVAGAVGPGCTRCDASSIEAYLASITN